MKTSKLKALVLSALIAGSFSFAQPADAAVQVNPIPGISKDFIKGADVSMLPEMESLGAKFYDIDGKQMDALQIMKNHGINWIRVRIWNDPKAGPGGGGNTDEARAIELAKRAKALGMKTLVDFHYSDWWADPGKQHTPAAWKDMDKDQLKKALYDYTYKVMKDFQAAGVEPDMVQVGNEVKSGMCWPIGQFPGQDEGKNFSELLAAGLQAVRDADPDHSIKRMVHLPDGGSNDFYRYFFDLVINKYGVNDFDIIGLSYYPFWHGTFDQLQQNMDDVSARYDKDVIVVETAFGYTNENFDDMKNSYDAKAELIGGMRSTVQGQATGLRKVMEAEVKVPNGRGTGIFYWEPDWYPVAGAGWKTGEGNEWDNLAMFDKNGKALESWEVFNKVSDQSGKVVESKFKSIDNVTANGGVGAPIALPSQTRVTYTDDHAEMMDITWKNAEPVYDKAGSYKVKGHVDKVNKDVTCEVTVINKVNLVKNPDFEKKTLDGWTITGDASAVTIDSSAGNALGTGAMKYWAADAFKFDATQTIKNLKPGKYTLAVKTQGGGGQFKYQLFLKGDNGKFEAVTITDTKWNEWHTWEIKDVEIKNGEATIGIMMEATPGNWGSMDDFEFYLQE